MPDPEVKIEPGPASVPEVKAEVKPEVTPEAKPEVKAETTTEIKPEVKPEPKPDWRDSRIAELTAKLNAAKAAKLEPPKAVGETDADFETRVNARAEILASEKAQVAEWNQKCESVFKTGTAEFPDFKDRLGACQSVVNAKDPEEVKLYNDVLAAAIETGKAPQLIHALGENPGEFQRIMKLSPVKRGMELATMATRLEAAPEPSQLEKPITVIGGKGERHEEIKPDDAVRGGKLSTAEWMKRRNAQAVERGIQ